MRAILLTCSLVFSTGVLYFWFEMPLETVLFRGFFLISLLALMYNYRQIPWLAQIVDDYLEAKKVEKYHWKHDKDLVQMKKVRYFLWASCVGLLCFGFFKLDSADPEYIYSCMVAGMKAHEFYSEGFLYLKLACGIFFVDATLYLVCNIHIAAYRNPVTPNWVYKVCVDCARFGFSAAAIYGVSEITVDRAPHSEISHTANRFNSWSPTGRGYGYDTVGSKELDRSLQSVKGYNSLDHVKKLEGSFPEYKQTDENSIREWCLKNDGQVKKSLNYAQRLRVNVPSK